MRSKHLSAELHAKCYFLACRGSGWRPRYMHFSKSLVRSERLLSTSACARLDSKPRDSCLSPRQENEKTKRKEKEIMAYYRALSLAWGAQHRWPAESRFEVIVGAYLTQNTAWTNVEKALANLRTAESLSAEGIRRAPLARLERLIRPSGYFRQKAKRLKTFVAFLDKKHGGSRARRAHCRACAGHPGRGSLALRHEHGRAHALGADLQRDARAHRGGG